jgi:hypothetical protein
VRIEDDECNRGCSELRVLGPDFGVRLTTAEDSEWKTTIAPSLDKIVRAKGATQTIAQVRAERPDGSELWALNCPVTISGLGAAVIAPDGRMVITGSFSNELDFGNGTTVLTSPPAMFADFVAMLDANGVPLWVRGDTLPRSAIGFRPNGQALIVSGENGLTVTTVDSNGEVVSTISSAVTTNRLYAGSILSDETGIEIAGSEEASDTDLFLANVLDTSIAFQLHGHQSGDNYLTAVGMTQRSVFGNLGSSYADCAERGACGTPTYTVDNVSITGGAAVRLHR